MAIKTLTREEYANLLDAGVRFTNAYLYEANHNAHAVFVYVQLGKDLRVLKRMWA